ncbi:exodeoxyribonuclease III [Planoprotostelium fungivorum]|uniref:DNA-(apurinic or apyrimidinic site) endonuclease n=1 Tax=Planoprotostelium fungivorum TaxID=1890364 RepID=A0A2P6MYJ8_9EUKA|nr:exodeoxyribonuclease III [Planoprotostelium fungivorum]
MRIVSWNVNGIRAVLKRLPEGGLKGLFDRHSADVFCMQETKVDSTVDLSRELTHVEGFESFWSHCKTKKVVTFARIGKTKDASTSFFNEPRYDQEGRIMMTDHGSFVLFNIYFPNGGRGIERHEYKMGFYKAYEKRCKELVEQKRNIVTVGDVNTAFAEIDIHNPKEKEKSPCSGFLPDERQWMEDFFSAGFIDTFRHQHPGESGHYTWWDVKKNMRPSDKGWRIDYSIVNEDFISQVKDSKIMKEQHGSDHCPISIQVEDPPDLNINFIPPLSSRVKDKSGIAALFKAKGEINKKEEKNETVEERRENGIVDKRGGENSEMIAPGEESKRTEKDQPNTKDVKKTKETSQQNRPKKKTKEAKTGSILSFFQVVKKND